MSKNQKQVNRTEAEETALALLTANGVRLETERIVLGDGVPPSIEKVDVYYALDVLGELQWRAKRMRKVLLQISKASLGVSSKLAKKVLEEVEK